MLKFARLSDKPPCGDAVLDTILIADIRPNPSQPRKTFHEEGIAELAQSIRNYGLLQPVTVRRTESGYYELIAGERRLRACKMLGETSIPAIVLEPSVEQDSAILAMIENLQRENLHFFEEAEGYLSLMKEHGFTQEMLARKLGKNQSTVANKLRNLKLPRNVRNCIVHAGLTERHARTLLRLHNEEIQLKLIKVIVKNALSVRETEQMVELEIKKLYDGESPGKKLAYLFRDYRIYINTIKKAVNQVKDAGVSAHLSVEEKEDAVNINIRLVKPQSVVFK
jgi:ParB family chromosome partitioning protein